MFAGCLLHISPPRPSRAQSRMTTAMSLVKQAATYIEERRKREATESGLRQKQSYERKHAPGAGEGPAEAAAEATAEG